MAVDSHTLLTRIGHRPWPLPRGPWVMYQRWCDLLFMHWPVPAEQLRGRVPVELLLDTFEGDAWVSVTPFEVRGLRGRWLPPCPGLSRFPELNVRTYVRWRDRPGVYLFSLDAGSRIAVEAARLAYGLPYFRARMRIRRTPTAVRYGCVRTDRRAEAAGFLADYGPVGDVDPAAPGSLTHWLTERYRLYTVRGGRIFAADIHHVPWPLQPATAAVHANTMAASQGILLPDRAPLLSFVSRLDVLVWPPLRMDPEPSR